MEENTERGTTRRKATLVLEITISKERAGARRQLKLTPDRRCT